MLPKSLRLNYDDYLLFPEDGKRHEIIEGEHYMAPSPNVRHQSISRNLGFILNQYVEKHDLGKIYNAPMDVILSYENIVQPDILFISKKNYGIITTQNIQGAPDLLIEIMSESSRKLDRLIKMKTYGKFGVEEYWVIDPAINQIEVFRKDKTGLTLFKVVQEEEGELTSPLFPGLKVNLKKVFEEF
ncbi:MAG: Uma2 family endonuclease [bacterium]